MAISKIGSKALVDCSVVDADIADGTITSAKLAGSISNAKLANSSITVNGTAINLGASGSIQPVSWQSVVVSDGSTVTTMVAGNGYFVNNTSAAGLVKLPISASAGDTVTIKDYAGNFGTNSLTIQRNGHTIQGVANDSLISTNRASLTLVYVDSTKGWLYAVESNVADLGEPLFITATGGTVTTSGDFKIHSFTGDGCFSVSCAGDAAGSNILEYLVVAGGGSGGNGGLGGSGAGAGAGGFRFASPTQGSSNPLNAPAGLTASVASFPITVGAGGAYAPAVATRGANGANSVFSSITSAGGGAGGIGNPVSPTAPMGGAPGGSGGGARGSAVPGAPGATGGTGNTPPVSPAQGTNGGQNPAAPEKASAGGGGSIAAGATGGTPQCGAGNGGDGGIGAFVVPAFFGPTAPSYGQSPGPLAPNGRYFGGGGAGHGYNAPSSGTGGAGGGATSTCVSAGVAGTTNTGGGGSGGSGGSGHPNDSGGSGGSGIVIIRYKFQ